MNNRKSNAQNLVELARTEAEKIIEKNKSDMGIFASVEGYREVWARDSVIAFLGAAFGKEEGVMKSFFNTLETLRKYQNRFGQIPNYIAEEKKDFSYYSSDASQWYAIGLYYYYYLENRLDACSREVCLSAVKAMDWCESQETDRQNLIVSGEAMDWADLLANHGKVLFPNVLYVFALRCSAALVRTQFPKEAERFEKHAREVKEEIQNLLWVRQETEEFQDKSHWQSVQDAATRLRRVDYFLPWVDLFSYGEYFDTAGNLLAVLTNVADEKQKKKILNFIQNMGLDDPYPVKVLYPPICPGDKDWREYYRVYSLNLPHQYHNGGIWPWVGGLYIATLVKEGYYQKAEKELEKLAACVQQGEKEWEFNEWMMGTTGSPMGAKFQAWSAGMFLYAYYAVKNRKVSLF